VTCRTINLPGGGVAIVRLAPARRRYCRVPGCAARAERLCDHETSPGRTCSAGLCAAHTFSPAPGVDYCPRHREAYEARQRAPELPL
jgi:hypothetical protein